MGCPECDRLRGLFAAAIQKLAELRAKELAAIELRSQSQNKALEHELTAAQVELATLRRQLLDHEATHR